MTSRSSRKDLSVISIFLVLIALGLTAPPAVQADTSYIDAFTSAPFAGTPTSFTTGSVNTGLSYTCSGGDGCTFNHSTSGGDGNSARIDVLSDSYDTATETVTIASRDGKAFDFVSIWLDVIGDGVTITGFGPEPFTINVSTGSSGTYSPPGGNRSVTRVVLTSTDFYEDYIDTVTTVLDVPGMDVQGKGTTIVNGDSTPTAADGTDLGSTPAGTPVTQSFDIRSIGDDPLDLTGSPYVSISGSADLTISAQPTTDPIPSGSSEPFTVRCNPSGTGERSATVSISSDSEADPYTFDVACTGTAAPEINVERPASTTIADAGTDDAGSQYSGTAIIHTYTVRNTGSATLNVTNITSASPLNVTVNDIDPTSFTVASGGGTETFVVTYTVSGDGDFSFGLDITNNDADEGNYDISVSGAGDGELQCGGTGTYTFSSQSSVAIHVTDTGADLGCLLVDETAGDHPDGIGVSGGSGTKTGKYWTITARQSDGTSAATEGYLLNLTLPHSVTPHANASVCNYLGDAVWDCGRTSSTDTTVTRNGISSLSDWAVGNDVATAITLHSLRARSGSASFPILALIALAFIGPSNLAPRRRARQ